MERGREGERWREGRSEGKREGERLAAPYIYIIMYIIYLQRVSLLATVVSSHTPHSAREDEALRLSCTVDN